jgi:transposase
MPLSRQLCDRISGNRQKNRQFNEGSRMVMVAATAIGLSQSEIARCFRTCHRTVAKIVNAFDDRDAFTPKPRPGCPPKLSEAEKRYIIQQTKRNRRISWQCLLGTVTCAGWRVSMSTVQRVGGDTATAGEGLG